MTNDEPPTAKIARGRVADQILADLRGQILRGELTDGTKLPAERDLAAAYGVSGATVREAVRVLTATGLVSVRHGSGSYVHAKADTLIATLLASVVELERANLTDLLEMAQALNAQAARLAADRATPDELVALRDTAENVRDTTVDEIVGGLRRFFSTLRNVSHNPLLATLGKFLMEIQLEMAIDLSASRLDHWQVPAHELASERVALVEAIEAHDPDRAAALVSGYHTHLLSIIDSLPRTAKLKREDPGMTGYLTSFLTSRANL